MAVSYLQQRRAFREEVKANAVVPGSVARSVAAKLGEVLSVLDLDAAVDGTTDNATAFGSARAAAEAAKVNAPSGAGSDKRGRYVINIPPGTYRVTATESLIRAAYTTKTRGLVIRGAGDNITTLVYDPAVAGTPMFKNSYWQLIHFEGIEFVGTDATADFFESVEVSGNSNCQDYSFDRCSWRGTWRYCMHVRGGNNNSEMKWTRCGVHDAMQAWLYTPASGAADQHLNFWFDKCKFWPTSSSVLCQWAVMNMGGHLKIRDSDLSGWVPNAECYLFELLGTAHAQGVCTAIIDGLRCEIKNTNGRFLKTNWPNNGNILLSGIDLSSQASFHTFDYPMIQHRASNTGGCLLTIRDSHMVGQIEAFNSTNDYLKDPRILVENCVWEQFTRPDEAVLTTANSSHTNRGGYQVVRFRNCRTNVALTSNHHAVWDADINARFAHCANASIRTLSMHRPSGALPASTDSAGICTAILPLNSMVLGVQVIVAAGQSAEGSVVSYRLDGGLSSPSEIITLTSDVNASVGFNETNTLSVPYLCDTADKCYLTLKGHADTSNGISGAFFLVHYISG